MRALLLLSLAIGGCGLFVEDDSDLGAFSSYESYLAERAEREADLARLVGDAEAGALDACRAVAVGEKACGGPASYAVFSTEASDSAEVEALADLLAQMDRRANRQFGLASTCELTPEPTVVLADGRCRAE